MSIYVNGLNIKSWTINWAKKNCELNVRITWEKANSKVEQKWIILLQDDNLFYSDKTQKKSKREKS